MLRGSGQPIGAIPIGHLDPRVAADTLAEGQWLAANDYEECHDPLMAQSTLEGLGCVGDRRLRARLGRAAGAGTRAQALREDRPFARLTRHRHVATHHARELTGDGKPEPRAPRYCRAVE